HAVRVVGFLRGFQSLQGLWLFFNVVRLASFGPSRSQPFGIVFRRGLGSSLSRRALCLTSRLTLTLPPRADRLR
ncbi:hypothetical protein RZS08_45755, partial [Arthrospira platensis SPKY1]|nr:hypothetical protein [Arthrospira platensis SPKY1]